MKTENMMALIKDPRLSVRADEREELLGQVMEQNWDFECPEVVIMLARDIDPMQPGGECGLPRVLQGASWSRPVVGLGCVAVMRLRLADLLEVLSCEYVDRIEGRDNYHPLE
ncbi:MAG: hypothetical protein KBE65_20700 [Phycisphaerae bacterium]|nr:hypothetical protein [Phycisphaerae bacterium]